MEERVGTLLKKRNLPHLPLPLRPSASLVRMEGGALRGGEGEAVPSEGRAVRLGRLAKLASTYRLFTTAF